MLWAMRAAMFLAHAAIGTTLALAVSAAISRHWKVAIRRLAAAALAFVIGVFAMGLFAAAHATSVYPGHAVDPVQKARVVGETIATQMNSATFGFALGLVASAALAWRSRRTRHSSSA